MLYEKFANILLQYYISSFSIIPDAIISLLNVFFSNLWRLPYVYRCVAVVNTDQITICLVQYQLVIVGDLLCTYSTIII